LTWRRTQVKRQRRSRALDEDDEDLARALEISKREAEQLRQSQASQDGGVVQQPGSSSSSTVNGKAALGVSPSPGRRSPPSSSAAKGKDKGKGNKAAKRKYAIDETTSESESEMPAPATGPEAKGKKRPLLDDDSDSEGFDGAAEDKGGVGGGGAKTGGAGGSGEVACERTGSGSSSRANNAFLSRRQSLDKKSTGSPSRASRAAERQDKKQNTPQRQGGAKPPGSKASKFARKGAKQESIVEDEDEDEVTLHQFGVWS
jgi:hypothetical protein